ncbi:MAG TPA: hypothetical protein VMZ05_06605 [Spirochaetota bacterium]|nr:hypothetical protein [Spirochaetota bacterium]
MNGNSKAVELPHDYMMKLVNENGDCPLEKTFSKEQIERRVAFYEELNSKRAKLPRHNRTVERKFAVYGWKDTTTVRVYMRETIEKIADQLFFSDFRIITRNIHPENPNGEADKDRGHVEVTVRATEHEIETLLEYIKPGASYYVYDGERSKYLAGDTRRSLFVITKPGHRLQPESSWRRSRSFIYRVEELKPDGPAGSLR